jgi:hypothetical protein
MRSFSAFSSSGIVVLVAYSWLATLTGTKYWLRRAMIFGLESELALSAEAPPQQR